MPRAIYGGLGEVYGGVVQGADAARLAEDSHLRRLNEEAIRRAEARETGEAHFAGVIAVDSTIDGPEADDEVPGATS